MQMQNEPPDPILQLKVVTGLSKLSQVMKTQAWKGATPQRLTPTQGQILRRLHTARRGLPLSQLATDLGITAATASDAVSMLVKKQLVVKTRDPQDGRQLQITLSPTGIQEAEKALEWTDFLSQAVGTLDASEQGVLLQTLMRLIQVLQHNGQIAPVHMCFNCAFFRPNTYADPQAPHHCQFIGSALKVQELQLDCPDHQKLPVLSE